jgi:WD40 repeat protein
MTRCMYGTPMTGKKIATYSRHDNTVMSIDFALAGHQVATGCADGTVHVWSLATPRSTQLTYSGHLQAPAVSEFDRRAGLISVRAARGSPDGRQIASAGGHDVRVWTVSSGRTTLTTRWDDKSDGHSMADW